MTGFITATGSSSPLETAAAAELPDSDVICLRISHDERSYAAFSWSIDGHTFTSIGISFRTGMLGRALVLAHAERAHLKSAYVIRSRHRERAAWRSEKRTLEGR